MSNRSIAELNDQFRCGPSDVPGKIMLTSGIAVLGEEVVEIIMQKVRDFNDFTEANDPYGEHDFGSFDHEGDKIFWKFDYFDPTLQYHSEDKADPSKTMRVLTIMFASEY